MYTGTRVARQAAIRSSICCCNPDSSAAKSRVSGSAPPEASYSRFASIVVMHSITTASPG
ncbi:hypothetical protein D3C76_1846800 [compost metagenome]